VLDIEIGKNYEEVIRTEEQEILWRKECPTGKDLDFDHTRQVPQCSQDIGWSSEPEGECGGDGSDMYSSETPWQDDKGSDEAAANRVKEDSRRIAILKADGL
jgi:hypothetical protein